MSKITLDFEKYNKKEWLEIIKNSLKKGSIEDFVWKLNDDINGEAFANIEDISDDSKPFKASGKEWINGLDYSLVSQDSFNRFLKNHIKNGLKSAIINVNSSKFNIESHLSGINLEEIDLIFNTRYGVDHILFLEHLKDYLLKYNFDFKKVNIVLRLPISRPQALLELYKYAKFNSFKLSFYFKSEREYSKDPIKYLKETFNSLSYFIKNSETDKEGLLWLLKDLKFHFFMNGNFLSDISTLRAFKVLWYNYLKAYKVDSFIPKILLGINHDSYTDDENNDLIIATVLCMTGAITDVYSINIAPKKEVVDIENMMRLMLNIQNIMKYESNMSVVNDALSGSYAIENATKTIAKKAWKEFK